MQLQCSEQLQSGLANFGFEFDPRSSSVAWDVRLTSQRSKPHQFI